MLRISRIRHIVSGLAGLLAALTVATAAAADTVHTLPGGNWSVLPDTTAGGSVTIVTGPGTPPAGIGSLKLHVDGASDRALAGTDLGALATRPWSGLSASYSTYIADGDPDGFTPTLRFAGFQVVTPAPANFTTLSFEPRHNGTITPGAWQQWTLGPDSIVWQTNTGDGFCGQAAKCTLAEFAARYPAGAWGQAQLGLGSGVAGPADGYADAVTITDGTTSQFTDFDPTPVPSRTPSAQPSPTGPTLPDTGTDAVSPALVGGLLLAVGTALAYGLRRRRLR
ncbi:MAG: LPXTG cell wall anchor domain-containing protein [Hamadaea sp.]|uniref:LPXTG cell wall anchor domain-containing protein n=1 Tax=Hamadaea sp. TaxID=2024425 RepID=UPI001820A001|nr:LPXTG cell wall anchor domain-containing protein [Hamadaea sp.]NUR71923.1 LPXTG cell wall anchor domain-containing protein [Hamadaea sp.]NUT18226.1 LPXTG cell wall anchor domain-containing protein [Hamadaea sp.]